MAGTREQRGGALMIHEFLTGQNMRNRTCSSALFPVVFSLEYLIVNHQLLCVNLSVYVLVHLSFPVACPSHVF